MLPHTQEQPFHRTMTQTEQPAQRPSRNGKGTSSKYEQILQSAGQLFLQQGYERTSMSQIAQLAGVSKGSLYNHFENKADLFTAFFEECSRTRLNTLKSVSQAPQPDLRTALEQAAATIISLMIDPEAIGLYRIVVAEANEFPNLADTLWHYGVSRTLTGLSEWFAEKHAAGQLIIKDIDLAAEQFLTMCQTRIIHRSRLSLPVDTSQASIDGVASMVADSFLRMYAP
ncbi:TetR/AcrR family transcriptional regulator [Bombella intestini]|nr:TetR/AcrR family transcriptional regulator [Bombella intestini]